MIDENKFLSVEKERVVTHNFLNYRQHCTMCGYHFKVGDNFRWIYAGNLPNNRGNFTVCLKCTEKGRLLLREEYQKKCEILDSNEYKFFPGRPNDT